jgi:hypothetical protein
MEEGALAGSPPEEEKAAKIGCWGSSSRGGEKMAALEKPLRDLLPSKQGRSFSRWWGSDRGQDAATADAAAAVEELADRLAQLETAEAEERLNPSPSKPAKHERKRSWSFPGRRVAPAPPLDPEPESEDGSPALSFEHPYKPNAPIFASDLARIDSCTTTSTGEVYEDGSTRGGGAQSSAETSAAAPAAVAVAVAAASPPRATGYRRLWDNITSMRKGDGPPQVLPTGQAEVTVDGLVKAIQVPISFQVCNFLV